jgi:hypothetical protein
MAYVVAIADSEIDWSIRAVAVSAGSAESTKC